MPQYSCQVSKYFPSCDTIILLENNISSIIFQYNRFTFEKVVIFYHLDNIFYQEKVKVWIFANRAVPEPFPELRYGDTITDVIRFIPLSTILLRKHLSRCTYMPEGLINGITSVSATGMTAGFLQSNMLLTEFLFLLITALLTAVKRGIFLSSIWMPTVQCAVKPNMLPKR